jgi:hypothetical protein
MGKQVGFFMSPEDEQGFANFVLEDRRVAFLPTQFDTEQIYVYRSLIEANQSQISGMLLIWNRGIGGELALRKYGPGNVRVDRSNDPVIEFIRSFQHGEHLIAGRIWAETKAFDPTGQGVTHKVRNLNNGTTRSRDGSADIMSAKTNMVYILGRRRTSCLRKAN